MGTKQPRLPPPTKMSLLSVDFVALVLLVVIAIAMAATAIGTFWVRNDLHELEQKLLRLEKLLDDASLNFQEASFQGGSITG